jgi:Cu-Zn family superoxide dismutase
MKKTLVSLSLVAAAALLAGCASAKSGPMAMVTLTPTTGQTANGTVHFTQQSDGSVEVQVDLMGVPAGVHGFHVHEKGDCGDDAKNAGGHYNPTSMAHGAPDAASHHAGDFGNVTADGGGNVHTSFTTRSITVADGPNSVVGHAVVLHGNADDLVSQPAGNAGPRIACGVVSAVSGMAGDMHH